MQLTIPTLRNWIYQTPRNFLKYSREYGKLTGADFDSMATAVTEQEEVIYGTRRGLDS
jgi:hypothetical protein